MSCFSSQCHKADKLTDYFPDDFISQSDMELKSPTYCSRFREVLQLKVSSPLQGGRIYGKR